MGVVDSSSNVDLLKNSLLYRQFQAEREEVLRHKWLESEKVGYDIGFTRALTDWIIHHRTAWRRTYEREHPYESLHILNGSGERRTT